VASAYATILLSRRLEQFSSILPAAIAARCLVGLYGHCLPTGLIGHETSFGLKMLRVASMCCLIVLPKAGITSLRSKPTHSSLLWRAGTSAVLAFAQTLLSADREDIF